MAVASVKDCEVLTFIVSISESLKTQILKKKGFYKMKDVKTITTELENGVKAMFEDGTFENYLKFVGQFHSYSFNNTYLIMRQCPEASYVAGFQTWKKKFERNVRKGEKGIWILAPMQRTAKREVKDSDGNIKTEEYTYMAYKAVTVFDVSQTDGKELPTICKQLDGNAENFIVNFDKLKQFVGIPVEFENITDGSNGYFDKVKNRIAIRTGMSEAQTLKTTIHEIAHALLHGKGKKQEEADRETKELQAESVAYTVCNFMGLDTSEYSFGYICGWAREKTVKELQSNMNYITCTANDIINALC